MKVDTTALLRFISDALFRNLGLKSLALVMTAILFVSTRDDVTRSFEVPLRVERDPDRALLTELPATIRVQVSGPWTRLNRVQAFDFGVARFDLRGAQPGPLRIDEGAIVMPSGVVLSSIHYDHVDLRFEPIITADVPVSPAIVGQPAPEHRRVEVRIDPPRWQIRGGRSAVQLVPQLTTEPLDIDGVTADVAQRLDIVRPSADVTLVGASSGVPQVDVLVRVEPMAATRDIVVPVVPPEGFTDDGVLPPTYTVAVTGPLPRFRVLESLGIAFPIEADIALVDSPTGGGSKVVEVGFRWAASVPPAVREVLTFDPGPRRIATAPAEAAGSPAPPPM